MKYIVPEFNLKRFLRETFGVDLTNKITMITNVHQIPYSFDRQWNHNYANRILNRYGPMYLFEINKNEYIAQPREKVWRIIDTDDAPITEFEFMKVLGIQVLGLSIDNLLDLYLEEEQL